MKIPKFKFPQKRWSLFLIVPLLILVIFEAIFLFKNSNPAKATDPKLTLERCSSQSGSSSKLSCWEDLMDQVLANKGLGAAFDLMDNLYQTEPAFASDCHSFSHLLGQKAFQLYSDNKDFDVSPKSSYCGYGFYHGFMEELVHKTNNMNQARAFCEYVGQKLAPFIADAGGACYHGIGHGTVDGSDPRAWGNPEAMVKPALDLCEKVSNDENPPPRYGKLFRCTSGAFNSLEILMDSNQYKLSADKNDPFSICRTQPEKYQESCFVQFVVSAISITGGDFNKVAQLINTIPEDDSAIPSLQAVVVEMAHANKSYQETINFCHDQVSRFQMPCITAFGEGFLKYGPPQQEYVKAVDFCGSTLLSESEKLNCFNRVLSILRNFYTAAKSNQICHSVDPKYRSHDCSYI